MPSQLDALSKGNVTYNYHHFCITDSSLLQAKLDSFYLPLAYSIDKLDKDFIVIMEAIDYPF